MRFQRKLTQTQSLPCVHHSSDGVASDRHDAGSCTAVCTGGQPLTRPNGTDAFTNLARSHGADSSAHHTSSHGAHTGTHHTRPNGANLRAIIARSHRTDICAHEQSK